MIVVASLLLSIITKKKKETLVSPLIPILGEQDIRSSSALGKEIERALDGVKGTYSIVVINLSTGETYSLNPDRTYYSASLYKLWLMAVVYQELKDGKLKEDDILQAAIPDLNETFHIASEDAELTEGTIERTVKEALEQSITISHNYSALLLTKKVGVSKIAAFLKQEGFTNSKVGNPPLTTPSDIATFYLKLYRKELIDEKSSTAMIELLKRQVLNDRIPKYLPDDIQVAHKTGELYQYKHDAGIVFTPKGDYIFVALSETNNPAKAAERIAELSKIVYTYFEKNH